jgi:alkylation response protein AidB-like acyl-CoA dehydrogenase
MDFRFGETEEKFRAEVREFLKEYAPPNMGEAQGEGAFDRSRMSPEMKRFEAKVIEKRWHVMAWPKEYGGLEKSVTEQLVFKEEMAKANAPGTVTGGFGIGIVGPTILQYGTEEQKHYHIPKIINNEITWCLFYSEPNSGSDLASLQTRAVEDGDFYVVNGQKIWTSGAQHAQWGLLAARTDPTAIKHRGISMLLVPTKTPGITIQPLMNMGGAAGFNQVFFDNVRIPKENLLGVKNRGWQQMRVALAFERSFAAINLQMQRNIEELVAYSREHTRNGHSLSKAPLLRQKLADLLVRVRVGRDLSYRVVWMQSKKMTVPYEANEDKLFNSELQQQIARVSMEMVGLWGQVEKDPRAPMKGRIEQSYRSTVGITIAAGTSEIQRNVIAQGLGLPRSYDP